MYQRQPKSPNICVTLQSNILKTMANSRLSKTDVPIKVALLILGICTPILSFAQRMRARPEDYEDYPDYSSTSDMPAAFWLVLLVILAIGIIWFKSSLSNSRKEEIRSKTQFLTNREVLAYESPTMAINHSFYKTNPKEYFTAEKMVVKIPKYAKCIILEYYPENRSYVKVKFEKYPTPLYLDRGYLRTPERINT